MMTDLVQITQILITRYSTLPKDVKMKAYVRYYNKPHDLKLSGINIVPLAKGIWYVTCDMNLRGYDIVSWGNSSGGNKLSIHKTFFGDDDDIRAALILKSETKEESDIAVQCDRVSKKTYSAILVSSKLFSKKWNEYCKSRLTDLCSTLKSSAEKHFNVRRVRVEIKTDRRKK